MATLLEVSNQATSWPFVDQLTSVYKLIYISVFCSVFSRSYSQQINLQPHEDTSSIDIEQNQTAEESQPSSSSNNILNQNLSGSFRDPQSFGDRNATIYAPSAPPTEPRWPTATQYQPLSTVPRLGVAAIPNQNFNQMHDVPPGDEQEAIAGQSRRNQRGRGDTQRPPAPSQQYFV